MSLTDGVWSDEVDEAGGEADEKQRESCPREELERSGEVGPSEEPDTC